jgi:hypothetical protein
VRAGPLGRQRRCRRRRRRAAPRLCPRLATARAPGWRPPPPGACCRVAGPVSGGRARAGPAPGPRQVLETRPGDPVDVLETALLVKKAAAAGPRRGGAPAPPGVSRVCMRAVVHRAPAPR